MKKAILLLAFAASMHCYADNVVTTPNELNVAGMEWPKVGTDHKVYFQIMAPGAQTIEVLMGDKKTALTKNEMGVWTGNTDPMPLGFHYYNLFIDGMKVADPATETFYASGRQSAWRLPRAMRATTIVRSRAWPKAPFAGCPITASTKPVGAMLWCICRPSMTRTPRSAIPCYICSMAPARTKRAGRATRAA